MIHKDFCKSSAVSGILQQTMSDGSVRTFRSGRVLGKGGFAKCFLVTQDQSTNRYACKVIDKEKLNHDALKQKLQSEIEIHSKLHHKHIVKFQKVFEDEKYLYILLELCTNNTLNELLKRRATIHEVQVRYYLKQILEALLYLHQKKIVHRDLKLDNFFVDENLKIKVGDFGLAAKMGTKNRKSICGTPNYMAPEIFQQKNGYSYEIDIWSVGIATYLLLYGCYPFDFESYRNTSGKVSREYYINYFNPAVSDISIDFIGKMLQVKPHDRWTVKQLLNHQFFTQFEIPESLPRTSLACINKTFLDQFKNKKMKIDKVKEDEEFNFMLQSKEHPKSPRKRVRHSTISQSMSASKILRLAQKQNLPYIFSQKKVSSFKYQGNLIQPKLSLQMNEWISQWWEDPKYGLLYQLNDGNVGFFFNDSTNLQGINFSSKVTFFDKKGKKSIIKMKKLKYIDNGKEILSKMKILQSSINKVGLKGEEIKSCDIFIRRYIFSSKMFILWLSNGQLQCRFEDKSELKIGKRHCMYINPQKIKIIFQSKTLNEQNEEVIKKQQKLSSYLKSIKELNINASNKQNEVPN